MKVLWFLAYLVAKTSNNPVIYIFFSRWEERFQCHDVPHSKISQGVFINNIIRTIISHVLWLSGRLFWKTCFLPLHFDWPHLIQCFCQICFMPLKKACRLQNKLCKPQINVLLQSAAKSNIVKTLTKIDATRLKRRN